MSTRFDIEPASVAESYLADWIEAALLFENLDAIDRATIRRRLSSQAALHEEDVDVKVGVVLNEINSRKRAAPQGYPFYTEKRKVKKSSLVDHRPYEFLLWLSLSEIYREEKRFSEIEQLFNGLVRQALGSYLDSPGTALVFALPPRDGRPPEFPAAIEWLAEKLRLSAGSAEPPLRGNDGGVDVVAWRPFRDNKNAHPIVLCQCTVQLSRWARKAHDVEPNQWREWIVFDREPLVGLAVPFANSSSIQEWRRARKAADIVFDRLRICDLVSNITVHDVDEMDIWSQAERTKVVATS